MCNCSNSQIFVTETFQKAERPDQRDPVQLSTVVMVEPMGLAVGAVCPHRHAHHSFPTFIMIPDLY